MACNLTTCETYKVGSRAAFERTVSVEVVCRHVVCRERTGIEVPRAATVSVADDARFNVGGIDIDFAPAEIDSLCLTVVGQLVEYVALRLSIDG